MSYQNIFFDRIKQEIHLWDADKGYTSFPYKSYAYRKKVGGNYKSIYGDELEKIRTTYGDFTPEFYESDVNPEMRVLLDLYKNTDEPSTGHKIAVIDIEVDSEGGFPNIETGDKALTAIALYDQVTAKYYCFVLDPDSKITNTSNSDTIIVSCPTENELIEVYPPDESGKWGYAYKQSGIFAESAVKEAIQQGTPSNEDNFFNALRLVYKSVNDLIKEENQLNSIN